MRAYVCLIPCMLSGERHERGDILVADQESGSARMGFEWAAFEPPDWLEGVPELQDVGEPVEGTLIFRYTLLECDVQFSVKARIGIPVAVVSVDGEEGVPNVQCDESYQFLGCISAAAGGIRWAPGGCTPESRPAEEYEALTWGLRDGA